MNLAVIETGGKQYIVTPGQTIKVEKIVKPDGEEIEFDQVLLVESGKKVLVGTPLVKGATVTAKVIGQVKSKKSISFRYKAKTRSKVKQGHRQKLTEVEVLKINVAK